MTDVRLLALRSLLRCDRDDKFANLELDSAITKNNLTGKDRSFFTALVYGCIQWQTSLDYVISLYCNRPLEKMDSEVIWILRLGVLQIRHLDRIPDSAACNESVNLCRKVGVSSAASFVNAVLRKTAKNKESLVYPNAEREPVAYLSARYGFPSPLAADFLRRFRFSRAESLLDSFNRQPQLTLRVNTLKTNREALLERLQAQGITAEPTEIVDTGIRIINDIPISELDILKEHLAFVQDEASQFCSALTGAQPGDNVMDCCCCPGGKTFSLAMHMENKGRIEAFDLHGNKLSLVEKGACALGIDIITCREHDSSAFLENRVKTMDRVLCDVPCSGFGVIAKKPDIRHKDPTCPQRLIMLQRAILDTCARYVKDGGTLVYSTCTVFEEENEETVRLFAEGHPDFRIEFIKTFYPDTDGTDGFFTAKLIRRN